MARSSLMPRSIRDDDIHVDGGRNAVDGAGRIADDDNRMEYYYDIDDDGEEGGS
jgi:hypothetical protein